MGLILAVSTVVWLGCGLAVLVVGGLVRSRGRLDLLATADASADRDEAAVTAGTLVLVAGGVIVCYGLFELYAGFSTAALFLCVTLVVGLSVAAAVRVRGR